MTLAPPAAEDTPGIRMHSASQNQSPVVEQRDKQHQLFIVSSCGSFT